MFRCTNWCVKVGRMRMCNNNTSCSDGWFQSELFACVRGLYLCDEEQIPLYVQVESERFSLPLRVIDMAERALWTKSWFVT
jgi:hypothetical protein